MNAVETAKGLIASAVKATVDKSRELYPEHGTQPDPPGPVSVTIAASQSEIRALWTEPTRLSAVLGNLATLTREGNGDVRWTAARMNGDIQFVTRIEHDADTVTFVRTDNDASAPTNEQAPENNSSAESAAPALHLTLRPAPQNLGTEVSLQVNLPIPELIAKTVAFTLLYRSRALLQTGEIPTLHPLPAARPSNS